MNIAGKNFIERSNPYTQSGLVSMYDGIWNQSIGVHDPFAIIWKNLICEDEDLVATTRTDYINTPASVAWNETGISGRQGYGFWCTDPKSIKSALFGKKLSYDICFTSNESSYETGYYGLFGICYNTYEYTAWNISIHWVNTYSGFRISAFDNDNYMATSNTKLQQNFFSINMDFGANKQVQLFKNGILVGSSSEKIGNISRVNVSKLGLQVLFFNSGYYYNFNCQVSLHAIRFYNKIRTENEIMHNYLVDRERFGA